MLLRYRPPQTERSISGERERLARRLAREIRSWVTSFELSDTERQQVIERAGFLLDDSLLNADDNCLFDENRALSELLGIWKPKIITAADRDLQTLISRWLASWIRFWITQPIVWNRALDLEFAHFGARAQAA